MPALIHASDRELFTGDAIELAHRWRRTGAQCELQQWPDQIHVFQAFPMIIPEARSAYRAAARFIATQLDHTEPHPHGLTANLLSNT